MVRTPDSPSVRVSVSLPPDVAAWLEAERQLHQVPRSRIVTAALRRMMRSAQQKADAKAQRG